MGEPKKIKVLNDLLESTKEETQADYNFDKIMSLIEKTKEMKKEENMRYQRTNDYFKKLKDQLDESSAYLDKARKDISNTNEIKIRNNPDYNTVENYEILLKKSDDEIQEEMDQIKSQIDLLNSRVKSFNERSKSADDFYTKSMETLKEISSNLTFEK